jgi:hypothetical protein
MRKRGSIVCKSRPCLPKAPTNSARIRSVVTAALQWQYLQTEHILLIRFVLSRLGKVNDYMRVINLQVSGAGNCVLNSISTHVCDIIQL